jgi:uncharacterized membrane protein YqjE
MDMRVLGLIQRSIPALLLHLDGYVELVERDWSRAKHNAMRQLRWLAILLISAPVALLLACALIIAVTWNGEYRALAIGLMAGGFTLLAIVAGAFLARRNEEAFAVVRRELQADRELLREFLSSSEPASRTASH